MKSQIQNDRKKEYRAPALRIVELRTDLGLCFSSLGGGQNEDIEYDYLD